MNQYITGTMIKNLREKRKMTQHQLAEQINVSDKTVSKWETGRGYPDVSLIEPLSAALGVSVIELFSGENVTNANRASNMRRMKLHVCPLCGNVIQSTGEAIISCCGIVLPALEPEPEEEPGTQPGTQPKLQSALASHHLDVSRVEDEYYVTLDHEMSKTHYISFICAVRDDGCDFKKLYPEGPAEARFKISGTRFFYYYCNQHGLFKAGI